MRDCTSPAPAAYQYTTFPLGTEDCLTLDIYSSAEAKKRPVLVYLHGSAATGSSLELPGSELVRDAGCVFVALNYRLGLFGWNCLPALTSGSDAAGNFALLDIARALDWVKENIHRFGRAMPTTSPSAASLTAGGWRGPCRQPALPRTLPKSRRHLRRTVPRRPGRRRPEAG